MKELGTFIAASLNQIHPDDVVAVKAASDKLQGEFKEVGQLIATASYQLLKIAGREATTSAQHMKALSETKDWHDEFNTPCQLALEVFSRREKTANIATAATGMGAEVATMLYLAALGVGGVGAAALWKANREVQDESKDTNSLKAQIAVYDDMASDLDNKLEDYYAKNKAVEAEAGGYVG